MDYSLGPVSSGCWLGLVNGEQRQELRGQGEVGVHVLLGLSLSGGHGLVLTLHHRLLTGGPLLAVPSPSLSLELPAGSSLGLLHPYLLVVSFP